MSPALIPFTVMGVMGVMGVLGAMGRTCLAAETSVGSGNGSDARPRSFHMRRALECAGALVRQIFVVTGNFFCHWPVAA
jgi:hypothetical protein